jgi:hypothetical protein
LELLLPEALLPSQLRAELPVQPSGFALPQAPIVMPIAGKPRLKQGATRSSSRSSVGFRCLMRFTSPHVMAKQIA